MIYIVNHNFGVEKFRIIGMATLLIIYSIGVCFCKHRCCI